MSKLKFRKKNAAYAAAQWAFNRTMINSWLREVFELKRGTPEHSKAMRMIEKSVIVRALKNQYGGEAPRWVSFSPSEKARLTKLRADIKAHATLQLQSAFGRFNEATGGQGSKRRAGK